MSKQHEQGFTLIELLIVGVIICILSTLVAMTYSGVQAKNRNASRQASIDTLKSQLETYYAQYTKYPSLAELNNNAWLDKNLKKLSHDDLQDPQWNSKVAACTEHGAAVLADKPAAKCYSYQATTADGSPCLAAKVDCAQYTLTATLEDGEKYVKSSLN